MFSYKCPSPGPPGLASLPGRRGLASPPGRRSLASLPGHTFNCVNDSLCVRLSPNFLQIFEFNV
jgi:hypothetical protein